MRDRLPKRALLALILISVAASAIAATEVTGESNRSTPPLTFTIVGKLDAAQYVDNQPPGPSAGDVLVFSQKLYDRAETRLIGSDRASCTRTTAQRGDYLCSGAFLLGRGQVTIGGIDPPESVTRHPLVVTGGSGGYRGVRGEITVHHVSPTKDRFDFQMSR